MGSSNAKAKPSSSEAGLSMVETVIVFLVIAIVMAFTVPAVSKSIRAYNLRSAGNHLAERLAAVRALAMSKNENVTFSFNNTSEKYGFDFTGSNGDGVPDTTDPDNPSFAYHPESLPSGIAAVFSDAAPIKVTFNSRGEMPIGSTERTVVIRSDNKTVTVRVNLRGRVTVE